MSRSFFQHRPTLARPARAFPLVRRLSPYATWVLARTPLSANQVTALSLVLGLAGSWFFAQGGHGPGLVGAGLVLGCYILDNADGEIARIKGQSSAFGMHFDTFVDVVVHAAVFSAIGVGHAAATGDTLWAWLGWAAAAAMAGNYFTAILLARRARQRQGNPDPTGRRAAESPSRPNTVREWALFIYREAFRADFCFLLLALAAADQVWLLLPAGAVGAPVYWATQFARDVDKFHI